MEKWKKELAEETEKTFAIITASQRLGKEIRNVLGVLVENNNFSPDEVRQILVAALQQQEGIVEEGTVAWVEQNRPRG